RTRLGERIDRPVVSRFPCRTDPDRRLHRRFSIATLLLVAPALAVELGRTTVVGDGGLGAVGAGFEFGLRGLVVGRFDADAILGRSDVGYFEFDFFWEVAVALRGAQRLADRIDATVRASQVDVARNRHVGDRDVLAG